MGNGMARSDCEQERRLRLLWHGTRTLLSDLPRTELANSIDRAVERWMDRRIDGQIAEVGIPQGLPNLAGLHEALLELCT